MKDRDNMVIIYEMQGHKQEWRQIRKALKEAGISRVKARSWEDDPNLYAYPLDPRDFGAGGRIDRWIHSISVPMEDADLAMEIVLRLFPDYTPYERRVNRERDEVSGMVAPQNLKRKRTGRSQAGPEEDDRFNKKVFFGLIRKNMIGAVIVFAFSIYIILYAIFINEPETTQTQEAVAQEQQAETEAVIPQQAQYIEAVDAKGETVRIIYAEAPAQTQGGGYNWWMMLPLLLMPVMFIVILLFNMRTARNQAGGPQETAGNTFLLEKTDEEKRKTFDDIGGLKPLKEDLRVVVDFLGNPLKYREAGADLPKGLLLVGPPGTGKTLIAQVMASEAGVGFLYANASDFVEKYVGTGASRVRALFRKARKEDPCIVFIDEVDTLCGKRGDEMNAEDRKALTALLTEMDGFDKTDNILVIGATNRMEDIDEAALRPGRFTEIYTVPIPETVEERLEVIDIYMKNKKFAEDFDRRNFAHEMIGRSPAEIQGILNEAAIISVQKGLDYINKECIEVAVYKRLMHGHQTDHNETDPEDLKTIAYHEAGHALIARLTGSKVTKVTIMPSTSGAGGVTFIAPFEKKLHTKTMMENKVMELYGGKVAEYLLHGRDWDQTSQGCANDIERATHILKDMVDAYGMSENGLVNMRVLNRETGENSTRYIVQMSESLKERCVKLMEENIHRLEALAEALLKKDTLYEDEINEVLGLQQT